MRQHNVPGLLLFCAPVNLRWLDLQCPNFNGSEQRFRGRSGPKEEVPGVQGVHGREPMAKGLKPFPQLQGMKVAGDHLDLCLEGVLHLCLVSEHCEHCAFGWKFGAGKLWEAGVWFTKSCRPNWWPLANGETLGPNQWSPKLQPPKVSTHDIVLQSMFLWDNHVRGQCPELADVLLFIY